MADLWIVNHLTEVTSITRTGGRRRRIHHRSNPAQQIADIIR